ncbi:MAG: YceD family protein [Gammaproteobacteria bacterium]
MPSQPPEYIDPIRLADARAVLQGQVAVSGMVRLAPSLCSTQGAVDFELVFDVDLEGIRCVHGSLRTQLDVICQRCLQPMKLPLEANVALGVVVSMQEAETLPSAYEPLVVGVVPVSLKEMVEDELLLVLPVAPMHPEQQCPAWQERVVEVQEEPAQEGKKNPFAVLAQLKKT